MTIHKTVLSACLGAAGLCGPAAYAQDAPAQADQTKAQIKQQINAQVAQIPTQVVAQVRQQPAQAAQSAATVAIARGGSYIGIGIQEIDSDRAKALKLREEAGVEVTRVDKDSPAEKAGLMAGDAVIQYNGQRIEGLEQFSRMVRETPAGRDVKLDIWRNGGPQSVTVKVATRRGSVVAGDGFSFTIPEIPVMPDIPRSLMIWRTALLGVEAESLDGQLGQFFGVKEGVLVRSVIAGSAAEKAGVKAGDVITKVDDANVRTPSDLSSRVRGLRGKSVDIVVMRDRKEMTLNVMIADQQGGGGAVRRGARAARLLDGPELF
jgi:serine protease Do